MRDTTYHEFLATSTSCRLLLHEMRQDETFKKKKGFQKIYKFEST